MASPPLIKKSAFWIVDFLISGADPLWPDFFHFLGLFFFNASLSYFWYGQMLPGQMLTGQMLRYCWHWVCVGGWWWWWGGLQSHFRAKPNRCLEVSLGVRQQLVFLSIFFIVLNTRRVFNIISSVLFIGSSNFTVELLLFDSGAIVLGRGIIAVQSLSDDLAWGNYKQGQSWQQFGNKATRKRLIISRKLCVGQIRCNVEKNTEVQ